MMVASKRASLVVSTLALSLFLASSPASADPCSFLFGATPIESPFQKSEQLDVFFHEDSPATAMVKALFGKQVALQDLEAYLNTAIEKPEAVQPDGWTDTAQYVATARSLKARVIAYQEIVPLLSPRSRFDHDVLARIVNELFSDANVAEAWIDTRREFEPAGYLAVAQKVDPAVGLPEVAHTSEGIVIKHAKVSSIELVAFGNSFPGLVDVIKGADSSLAALDEFDFPGNWRDGRYRAENPSELGKNDSMREKVEKYASVWKMSAEALVQIEGISAGFDSGEYGAAARDVSIKLLGDAIDASDVISHLSAPGSYFPWKKAQPFIPRDLVKRLRDLRDRLESQRPVGQR